MTFEEFRDAAEAMLDEIPPEFTEELMGLHVMREARSEPEYRGVWRLGEYHDPGPRQFLGGNQGAMSRHIVLYYGSFQALAQNRTDFDWEEQLWDTLTHELRHHVESLAGDASLIAEDKRQQSGFPRRKAKKP